MGDTLVLAGATVVDGSGRPAFRANVAIADGMISELDETLRLGGKQVIDADGLVLAPGFIDSHTHTDGAAFKYPLAESKLFQGVTSEVTGNCGIGFFPVAPRFRGQLEGYLRTHDFAMPPRLDWTDFAGYAAQLGKSGLGVNHVPLVGHGALRIAVMGSEDRTPTPAEQSSMNDLLAASMQQGAWGFSTGLIYPPGSFAGIDELVALARVCAGYGGVYTSHIRGESATLMEAVDEAVEIGRQSGARVVISHLKPIGRANWGKGAALLDKIGQARGAGVDVTADQYPYEASSTSLATLIPARFHAGGADCLLTALADPGRRRDLIEGIEHELGVRGGAGKVMITSLASGDAAGLSGRTLEQIASMWGSTPAEAAVRLVQDEKGAVGAVYFSISEQDVDTIMRSPLVGVGSDGRGLRAEPAGGATHPRSYGTFPRVLGRYVRERKLLTLEAAVHKMTGLTAQRFGLKGRGIIAGGMIADLVLFDPLTIRDVSDFSHPHQYSIGIEHLFIKGVPVIAAGALTGNAAGRVLLRQP
jgi:N-acyl-D-amino-acid deacylase